MLDRIINQVVRQVTNTLVRGAMNGGTKIVTEQVQKMSSKRAASKTLPPEEDDQTPQR